jgi:hypothetical protein
VRFTLSLMACGLAWISGQQAPQRDSADLLARAVTSISGVVVEPGTQPVPLYRAVVTLRGPSLGAGRLAVTDIDGKFIFPGLPAGNFTLEAFRPGYVRTFYGSRLLGKGPGLALALRDGETVSDLTIQMLRGGVVTGTVRDAFGRPQVVRRSRWYPLTRGPACRSLDARRPSEQKDRVHTEPTDSSREDTSSSFSRASTITAPPSSLGAS